ncbi:MAG: peptidoglycan DD-metalloendopeptidase family protein [Propionivibrio sp.]|uniref:M23 family metallopeptidase n=1 Tax=Propionivibrio sp. TaxID=2212460 RepID=UPI001A490DE8|nr:peptidoglycan DD-metalloendopeptidase family protein [Propionivibrio sp.]MBL8416345.1 peptidoglycan DD-metalloendopeptidase family protein [Propionivibrio sp.]
MDKQQSRILAHSHAAIERSQRHRWVMAGVGSVALLGMVAAFALAPSGQESGFATQTVLEQLSTPAVTLINDENPSFLREERIQRSDTVSSLTARLGISDQDALEFILKNSETRVIAHQLRPGKVVSAKTGEHGELIVLYFPLNGKDAMLVVERRGNSFVSSEQVLQLEPQTIVKSGEIHSSLFGATDAAGIPDAIATQLAEIFGGDIDFYRDLRKGDRFSLVYEILAHRGQPIRSARILTAEFINNHKVYNAYWFQTEDGKGDYYTADGKTVRKAFLRSPLEFSRVTSGFTNARFHPVLQTWRAHKGVDYGAPTGTRVRSVADATVEFSGFQSGYGNMIILKHQGVYSTAYGHLSGFAAGIRKGSRVSQGDTIGYVGQTGLATGPHLHYEFRVNSQQVNPLTMTLPTTIPLEASQISRFKATTGPLRAQLELAKQFKLATIE